MLPIRMVATDLDQTLLRRDKTVSAYTRAVLRAVRRRGVLFCVATARPVRAVTGWLPWLEFDAGVFHSGAVLLLPGGEKQVLGIERPRALTETLLRAYPDCRLAAESDDRLFANFDAGEIWPNIDYTRTADFSELGEDPAEKLLLSEPPERLRRIESLLPGSLYLSVSENTLGMVLRKDAEKSRAVRLLAERCGVPLQNVAAFGDDVSDASMLSAVGFGVAVENALESVKTAARYRAADCDADGVARFLAEALALSPEEIAAGESLAPPNP